MSTPATDEAFRRAWKTEIQIGIDRGKLTMHDEKADLKSIPATPEDQREFAEKYGKQ